MASSGILRKSSLGGTTAAVAGGTWGGEEGPGEVALLLLVEPEEPGVEALHLPGAEPRLLLHPAVPAAAHGPDLPTGPAPVSRLSPPSAAAGSTSSCPSCFTRSFTKYFTKYFTRSFTRSPTVPCTRSGNPGICSDWSATGHGRPEVVSPC